MTFIDALNAGNYKYATGTGGTVKITLGDGDNVIQANAANLEIVTGNGNQQIVANAADSLSIQTGMSGMDLVIASADSAFINTNDSNDYIKFTGTQFDISAVGGNNTIIVDGNINNTTANNSITLGDGDLNQIHMVANNVDITAGNTNLAAAFVGNNVDIASGNGDKAIAFWGDNINMNFGNGNNSIATMDIAIAQGKYHEFADFVEADTTKNVSAPVKEYIDPDYTTDIEATIKKYNLSNKEAQTLRNLYAQGKLDDKLTADGLPLYALVKSPDLGTYVVAQRDSQNHCWSVNNYKNDAGNPRRSNYTADGRECIATTSAWTDTSLEAKRAYNMVTTTTFTVDGVKNVNINTGTGINDIRITAGLDDLDSIEVKSPGSGLVSITPGFTTQPVKDIIKTGYDILNSNMGILTSASTRTSPLIIDYNQDGVVSAEHARGIDLDGNGTADGCASNGDKMLAMTDINGNGIIDGSEVFGDETVNPFTGEKLNAANGFEALKKVAEAAEANTGIDCIGEDGLVNLKALKSALATKGIVLGFVSDDNNSTVEDLAKVAYIDTQNYTEQEDKGDVQHNQLGTSIFDDGSKVKVDDVWFTLT